MHITGVDFTSAPSRAKPLWFARCDFDEPARTLTLRTLEPHASFAPFDALLREPAPALLALDFPFGLPRTFVESMGWPTAWDALIAHVRAIGRPGFEQSVKTFRARQPAGAKHPLRVCDTAAGAASPINIVHPPVGKMFVEGALRLAAADLRIAPCREVWRERIAVEAYPALVARAAAGRVSYKGGDTLPQRTTRAAARAKVLASVQAGLPSYPALRLPADLADIILTDDEGDALDALLCALQGAWAWSRREQALGIPAHADPLEGWIIDPTLENPTIRTSKQTANTP